MHRILAQEPGGGLLPDWLADGPPWLQALALILAAAAVIALGYAASLAPAFADRIRGRPTTSPATQTASSEAPEDSPTTRRSEPAPEERYDAKMELIREMMRGLRADQTVAEDEARELRVALAEAVRREAALQAQLDASREKVGRLELQLELLSRSRDRPTPDV